MIRFVTLAAGAVLAVTSASAEQQPKADCSMYRKTSDGRWFSTIDSKVGNPKEFKVLKAGIAIDPGMTVVGINVVDAIEKLCGGG